jgi:hypothetical protein
MAMVEMLREIRRHMIRKLSYLSEGVYYVSPDELGETQYKKSDMHSFPKDPDFPQGEDSYVIRFNPLCENIFFPATKGRSSG